ncbi:hypothetical protein ACQZV8_19085 [Magnetococcales bacterium HHB-1]
MLAVARVIRRTPIQRIQRYFEKSHLEIKEMIDWSRPPTAIAKRLQHALNYQFPREAQARINADFERVNELTDEIGQNAIQNSVRNFERLRTLENEYERALWTLMNEPQSFRRAEEIRYADHNRMGRMWSGFVAPKNLEISQKSEHHRQFEEAIKIFFRSENAKVEIFERTRPCKENKISKLIQVVVYRDGLPSSFLEFLQDGKLTQKKRRPVYEVMFTYDPILGVIEVVSPGVKHRASLARLFAKHLLQKLILGQRISLRQYDLSRLIHPIQFSTDPQDGIRSVRVMDLGVTHEKLHGIEIGVKTKATSPHSVHEGRQELMLDAQSLSGEFSVIRATLSVKFQPDRESQRGKSFAVKLSSPNGCSLKGKTKKERIICDKYLPRWGLVREVYA